MSSKFLFHSMFLGWLVNAVFLFAMKVSGATVTTAMGNGADVEMREQSNNSSSLGPSINTRTSAAGDRNEIIGLRFDLSGYAVSDLTDVALELISFRDDANTRVVDLYGVTPGTVGGSGSFSTENWNETVLSAFGDLPGLLVTDGNFLTQSINSNAVTYLGQITVANAVEGSVEVFSPPALTTFVRGLSGTGFASFLLAAGNTSSGQFRIASKEASSTATSVLTGPAGTFAPSLNFTVLSNQPTAGLRFTNTWLTPGAVVLAGIGGSNGGAFVLLSSTNLTTPVTNWQAGATGFFDQNGMFIVTNPMGMGNAFFRLQTTNFSALPDFGLKGFATLNGGTTGGQGGVVETVTTQTAFRNAINAAGPGIVQINGAIDIGVSIFRDKTDKTILGLGTNATLYGNLQFQNCTNMAVRNLHLLYPSGDAMTVQDFSERIWIDHCSFGESGDGQLDITHGCSLITVSWCTFSYTNAANTHRFSSLVGHTDDNAFEDEGRFQITYHHNWWSSLCRERMPRVRFGQVHLLNNYYYAPGNNYCTLSATNAQVLIENNYYRQVDEPWRKETTGQIKALGNIFVSVTGTNVPASDNVFTPPYAYVPDSAADVPNVVTNHAGVGNGPFKP